jgi:uncharacterized protein YdaU (DUF1376 family)
MKVDTWMPLYVADLIADTMHLGRADFGSYVLLLCAYWRNKGPLKDDDVILSNICRVTLGEWTATRSALAPMFQIQDGHWHHKRIEAELKEAIRLLEARKRGADATNRGKRNARRAECDPLSATHCGVPSPSPFRSERDAEANPPIELPPGFPKTDAEAKCHSAFIGCSDAFTLMTWNKAVSRGGCDAKDIPIRNFRAYLAAEWSYEQNRKHRQNSGSNKPNHPPRVDRSAGTANEGRANDYANLGKMVVGVSNPQ